MVVLTRFGAKILVRSLASRILCPGVRTATSSSPYGICIISESRKHCLFKHTMKSLNKNASKIVNILLGSDRPVRSALLFGFTASATPCGYTINTRAQAVARRLPYWAIPPGPVATLAPLWGSSLTANKSLKNDFHSNLPYIHWEGYDCCPRGTESVNIMQKIVEKKIARAANERERNGGIRVVVWVRGRVHISERGAWARSVGGNAAAGPISTGRAFSLGHWGPRQMEICW